MEEPVITELSRSLESVTHDPFIDEFTSLVAPVAMKGAGHASAPTADPPPQLPSDLPARGA